MKKEFIIPLKALRKKQSKIKISGTSRRNVLCVFDIINLVGKLYLLMYMAKNILRHFPKKQTSCVK